MAAKKSGSPITLIATLLSVVLVLAVAYSLFKPDAPPPAAEVAQAPIIEPTPTVTPTPVASEPTATPTPSATATPTPAAETIVVTGSITDSVGNVVANGRIYVVPKTEDRPADMVRKAFARSEAHTIVSAGEDGTYRFSLPARRAYIAGPMSEEEPLNFLQEIAASEPGSAVELNFTLPRSYEIRGSVSDARAVTLPDVPLIVTWQTASLRTKDAPVQERRIRTAPDGRFTMEILEPARITVAIDQENLPAPYLYEKPQTVLTRADFGNAHTHRVDLELTSGVSFSGQVLAGTTAPNAGEGVEGVEVRISSTDATDTRRELSTTTDESGFFAFARLFPRDYMVTARLEGYNVAYIHNYRPQDVNYLEVTLDSLTTLRGGIAVDEESLAGATAVVSLIDRYQGRRAEAVIGTDLAADFTFEETGPGAYLLFAEATHGDRVWYGEKHILVESGGDDEVEPLTLRPLGEVRGTLVGLMPEGGYGTLNISAMKTAKSESLFPVDPTRSDWRRIPTGTTSDSGSFAVENLLLGEEYVLTVEERGTKKLLGAAVAVPGRSDALRVAVNGVGSVSGRVLNPRGEACPDVTLRLKTGLGTLQGTAGDVQERAIKTSFDGTYKFAFVPAGQARIVLVGDEPTARLISITPDQDLTIDLRCRTYVDIVFNVKDETEPFKSGEQFLVVPLPGTVILDPVKELKFEELRAMLEPGTYSITRTTTMESRTFDVVPRLDGVIDIDFSRTQ